jgi:hypothetical protein
LLDECRQGSTSNDITETRDNYLRRLPYELDMVPVPGGSQRRLELLTKEMVDRVNGSLRPNGNRHTLEEVNADYKIRSKYRKKYEKLQDQNLHPGRKAEPRSSSIKLLPLNIYMSSPFEKITFYERDRFFGSS